jgi:hypothetical protein
MYVSDGARRLLLAGERERFLNEEWPQVLAVINRLGFSAQELFAQTPALTHPAPPPRGGDTPPPRGSDTQPRGSDTKDE